jgi:type III pantothenate kinase
MAMLLLDAGNSALKLRQVEQGRDFRFDWGADWLWQDLSDVFDSLGEQPAWLASVAPPATRARVEASWNALYPRRPMRRLHSLPALGELTNAYRDPQQLGVDRWLALVAAARLTDADALVIDAGSAITLDLLSRRDGHLGGAILPGLNTDPERFYRMFPQIDFSDPEFRPAQRPGRSTRECLHPVGGRSLLPHLNHLLEQWGGLLEAPELMITGRDAGTLAVDLSLPARIVPDLVFRGMLNQIEALG